MTDYRYQDLKKFISKNVKESYCILPIRDGGLKTVAMKKTGKQNRWWHQRCDGFYGTPRGMEEFPVESLFENPIQIRKFVGSHFQDTTVSQRSVIKSLLHDTTGGLWYDDTASQVGNGGTTEFIFLKKNVDSSYSLIYLDNVAFYPDFWNCLVARNFIFRIYDYADTSNLHLHYPHFIRVSKVPSPNLKKRGE